MSIVTAVLKAGGDIVTASNNNDQRLDDLQMAGDHASAGGTGDAITLSLDAAIVSYLSGGTYKFTASASNTGAATININALGAKTIKKLNDQDLEAGDLESGMEVTLRYDGTNMQMLNPDAKRMSSADSDTLTNGSDAEALHVHPKPFADTGVTATINASGTYDVTFTPGFEVGVVEIHFGKITIPGTTPFEASARLFFDGTTFKWSSSYLTSSAVNMDPFVIGTANPTFSSGGVPSTWSFQITVVSVTSTQFTVRLTATKTSSPSSFTVRYGVVAHPA